MDSLPRMQHLRHLHIERSKTAFRNQALFISLCTNLETLTWNLFLKPVDVQILIERLRHLFKSLPHLRELRLNLPKILPGFTDDQVYLIIDLLPCLKNLGTLLHSHFGNSARLVKGPISKHFDILEKLVLQGFHDLDSGSNQILLSSCRHLRTFHSTLFSVDEDSHPLNTGPIEGQFGPLGWVCLRLSDLDFQYVDGAPGDNRRMYDLICFLRELERLRLATDCGGLAPTRIRWKDKESLRMWGCGMIFRMRFNGRHHRCLGSGPGSTAFAHMFDASIWHHEVLLLAKIPSCLSIFASPCYHHCFYTCK